MNNEMDKINKDVYSNIKKLMDNARNNVAREVNNILIQTYWEIGRIIVEDEQGNSDRAEYGKQLVTDLSRRLTKEYGKGFSRSNLQNMRNFYLSYPICQTVSGKLSWSHYCELLSISSVKTLKYNVIDNNAALERILWYSYYIPLLFIPTIGVLIALSLGKPESYKLPKRANILIVCAAILVLLVMTNDFHNLVFSFRPEDFRLHDEYLYSMAFWFVLAWEILARIVAFVLLIIKCRIPRSHTVLWLPIFTFLLTIIYGVLYMASFSPIRLLVDDMTATLCILFVAIWESCIKSGLIQANTHYGELLHSSTIGARITDESFKVIYSAENTMSFKVENLKSAAGEPVIFWDRGVRLSGASIQGGYVF